MATATLQAATLSAASNLLAQILLAYQMDTPLRMNLTSLFHFVLFTLVSTPPNYLWQDYLERTYPAYSRVAGSDRHIDAANVKVSVVDPAEPDLKGQEAERRRRRDDNDDDVVGPEKKINLRNTMVKWVLDQSLGAGLNTVAYIAAMSYFRGQTQAEVYGTVQKDFWPLFKAGLKLWPLVSLLNFTVVPLHQRIVVCSLVGLGWGVYLSLVTASQ
ncbi:MAG: hypothetical protein M1815_006230 [Lichina confinis]|nr:MAG: hypothetical protein M1815_006230 [Lichina confinis]